MKTVPGRRFALMTMGLGMVAGATGLATLHDGAASAAEPSLVPPGAKSLEELAARLSRTPRRRDFKTMAMILTHPDQWDPAALSEVLAYRGAPKQVCDNTGIAGPWLNAMRNSLNTQVWSFGHPDFLVVSATHGTAGLALLGPAMWEKYQLAKLTGGKFETNTWSRAKRVLPPIRKTTRTPKAYSRLTTTRSRRCSNAAWFFSPATTRYGNWRRS
jgi:hypothetical protein